MRVALVGDPIAGTAGDYDIESLADALAQRGHDVDLYTASRLQGSDARSYRVVQIPVQQTDGHLLPVIGDVSHFLRGHWRENAPSVVHCFGWTHGMAAQLAVRQRPTPVVQTLHRLADPARRHGERTPARDTASKLETLLARNATMVTASCTEEIDEVIRRGCRRARVAVLPSGVDVPDAFDTDGSAVPSRVSRHRIVALAQNFSVSHGLARVVAALPALPTAELILLAADDDDDPSRDGRGLLAAAERLGVADRTKVAAATDAREAMAWLRSADVAVCPAPYDPDTRTVLRAMSSGVPVVAADAGGPRDAVIAEVTGRLVAAGNTVELGRALLSILRENVLREGMGMAGRTRARSRYSWDRIATDAEAVYQAAVQQCVPAMSV